MIRKSAVGAMAAVYVPSGGFNLFFAPHYWSAFLPVAPTALVAFAIPRLQEMSWLGQALFGASLCALAVANLLSASGSMSVTVIAAVLPFIVLFATRRLTLAETERDVGAVHVAGGAAFAFSLGIYVAVFREAFGTAGFAHLVGRSTDRVVSSSGEAGPVGRAVPVLAINAVDVGEYALPTALALLPEPVLAFPALRGAVASRPGDAAVRTGWGAAAALSAAASWLTLWTLRQVSRTAAAGGPA